MGSSGYVGVATYSPFLKTPKQLKIDSMASIFTGEALAISLTLNYILDFSLSCNYLLGFKKRPRGISFIDATE